MKRSAVNTIMRAGGEMIERHGFFLPPFASWSCDGLLARREASLIVERRLGSDITDYGAGDSDRLGLLLFALRSGRLADREAVAACAMRKSC